MKILKESFEFLKKRKHVSFATSFEGKPKIRVFEVMDILENNIYFATSPKKEVWEQLMENPYVEILVYDENYSVRVEGKIHKLYDEKMCKRLYDLEQNLIFRELYPNFKDLVYFYLLSDKITFFDLTKRPPFIKNYDFRSTK